MRGSKAVVSNNRPRKAVLAAKVVNGGAKSLCLGLNGREKFVMTPCTTYPITRTPTAVDPATDSILPATTSTPTRDNKLRDTEAAPTNVQNTKYPRPKNFERKKRLFDQCPSFANEYLFCSSSFATDQTSASGSSFTTDLIQASGQWRAYCVLLSIRAIGCLPSGKIMENY
uniref:Uncharacterized protein n=1 Tax=Timema shepardi TaxID=629360 RepID=A0A7R9B0F1_TIMSH|nr:unnamed protein product [Timema shepardi]